MQVLQISMLRREANIFKLKYAFNQLKMQSRVNQLQDKHFSFRNQSQSKDKPMDIELENKELYLKYMQQVLERKEKELMQFEDYLLKHKKQQDEDEMQKSILNPLALTQLAQTLSKKVEVFRDIIQKYSSNSKNIPQLEKLAQSLEVVQQACRENYNELKETLLQNHQQLILQKEQLSAKISKLNELQSYEKYLNQLQNALQQKQYEIIQRESQMKTQESNSSHLSAIPNITPNYNTFVDQEQNSAHSQVSMRKRTKIFQQRNSSKPTELLSHNKSSKIMQERSTQQVITNPIQQSTHNSINNHKSQPSMVEQATQSAIDDQVLRNINRFNSQAHLLKFIKLWTKFSANNTKGSQQHRSLMFLYQWRLNTLFDENIKESVKEMVRWPRCLQPFSDLPPLNYAQLSLKKKKYLQTFFNFERRLFQRKKIKCHLSSILKNKNRRQRTAFLLYFRKFRQIARISSIIQAGNWQGQPLRQLSQHSQSNNTPTITKTFKQSRVISSSSLLLTEDKSKNSISKTKSNKSNVQSSQVRLKGREASVDISKLKQYIKSQEQNEARLAIQCLKIQSIFRLCAVLSTSTNKLYNKFFIGISKQSDHKRINNLQKTITSFQFRWELFMAKIRVALTSNTNKIGHLEQLVAFIGSDK